MANGFGLSYQPGSNDDDRLNRLQDRGGGRGISPQEAIKILSLRVPERRNPVAPISRDLMMSPGGAAAGADAFTSMVAQLIQALQPSGGGVAAPSGAVLPDSGRIDDVVRGPQMPAPVPTPPPPVTGGGDDPSRRTPSAPPPPPRVTPGDDGRGGTVPEPPPLDMADDGVALPPYLRGKRDSLMLNFDDFRAI